MNDFEKHLRSQAGPFQMDPAPGSFEQVMKALEKKKKRRFLFWLWLLVPGILTAAALWWGIPAMPTYQASALRSKISTLHYTAPVPSSNNKVEITTTPVTSSTHPYKVSNTTAQVSTTPRKRTLPYNHTHTEYITNQAQHISTLDTHSVQTDDLDIFTQPFGIRTPSQPVLPPVNSKRLLSFTPFGVIKHSLFTPLATKNPFKTSAHHRFAIGAYTQLGVMQSIFENNTDSTGTEYVSNRQSADKFLFSWSAGINFRYSPTPWLGIETGIGYNRYSSFQLIANTNFSGSADLLTPDSVYTLGANSSALVGTEKEFTNTYDYLSIPVKIVFQKKWNWIGVEGGAGINMDIPVNTSSYTSQPGNSISLYTNRVSQSKLSAFGLQVNTQLHAVFHIRHWSVYAGPVFKIRVTNMYTNDYGIRQYYYFLGAETGIRYNF